MDELVERRVEALLISSHAKRNWWHSQGGDVAGFKAAAIASDLEASRSKCFTVHPGEECCADPRPIFTRDADQVTNDARRWHRVHVLRFFGDRGEIHDQAAPPTADSPQHAHSDLSTVQNWSIESA